MDDLDYVVSGDSHIIEPFDLWTRTLVDKHGERLPQLVDNCNGVPRVYCLWRL